MCSRTFSFRNQTLFSWYILAERLLQLVLAFQSADMCSFYLPFIAWLTPVLRDFRWHQQYSKKKETIFADIRIQSTQFSSIHTRSFTWFFVATLSQNLYTRVRVQPQGHTLQTTKSLHRIKCISHSNALNLHRVFIGYGLLHGLLSNDVVLHVQCMNRDVSCRFVVRLM